MGWGSGWDLRVCPALAPLEKWEVGRCRKAWSDTSESVGLASTTVMEMVQKDKGAAYRWKKFVFLEN